jgi:hypothetical protein
MYPGKVAAIILGRGPLADPALSLPQLLVLLLAPVMPASAKCRAAPPAGATSSAHEAAGHSGSSSRASGSLPEPEPPSAAPGSSNKQRLSVDSGCSAAGVPPYAAAEAAIGAPAPGPAASLPPSPANRKPPNAAAPQRRGAAAAAKAALNCGAAAAFAAYCTGAGPAAIALKLWALWAMAAAMHALMAAAGRPAARLGLELAPHFDRPLASRSVSEFWGRRWNVTQALVLRRGAGRRGAGRLAGGQAGGGGRALAARV